MKRTFLDAGVLIAAASGRGEASKPASRILAEPNREFISSEFIRLEVVPKSVFNRKIEESVFYDEFFASVVEMIPVDNRMLSRAMSLACNAGLSAIDALHLAAAIIGEVDEFITTEKPSKPIHRVKLIPIVSIRNGSGMKVKGLE